MYGLGPYDDVSITSAPTRELEEIFYLSKIFLLVWHSFCILTKAERNMQTRAYVTVLAETVQGKGRTLFVRLGVIRTERRGGNVTPKVVLVFGRREDAA